MAYSTKYRAEFNDFRGSDWKVDILQDAFSGTITNLQCKDNPLVVYFDNESDDPFDPVRATKAELTVYSLTNFVLNDLYATEDRHFQVNIYKDDVLYLTGWVEVGNYSEPYDMPPYPVTIAITDGLETLKDTLYDDDGTPYEGRTLESEIILDILGKIGATTFTEFVNIYETNMDNGTDDSPMDQLYIDADVFADMYCWDVLAEILKKYNAYIRQIDGVFCIIRPTELTGTTVYGRTFTAASTKSSTSITTQQLISRSTGATNILQVPGGSMMIEQPVKRVTINQDYVNKESWVDNWRIGGDTYNDTTGTWDDWTNAGAGLNNINDYFKDEFDGVALPWSSTKYAYYIYQSFGSQIITTSNLLTFSIDYMLYNFDLAEATAEGLTLSVRIKANNNNKWLTESNSTTLAWSDTAESIDWPVDAEAGRGSWVTFTRNFETIPVTDSFTITIYGPYKATTSYVIGFFKNVKIVSTSNIVVEKRRKIDKITLLGALRIPGAKETANFLSAWKNKETINQDTVVFNEIIETNNINGIDLSRFVMLGDVVDSNIDNIIEQFAGALARKVTTQQYRIDTITLTGTSGRAGITCDGVVQSAEFNTSLTQTAADFVTNHAASYLTGGVVVTSLDEWIIFTSNVLGAEFTGSTTIENDTGDLDGTVALTQAANIYSMTPTVSWSRRGETDQKPLLEIIAEEIAFIFSRPKQLVQMPIIDKAATMSIDLSGNFQDGVNTINEFMRCFVVNRAKFEVRPRRWEIDLFEIGQGGVAPATGEITADSTIVITDSTIITADGGTL